MSGSDAVTKGARNPPRVARLLVPLVGIFFLVHPVQVVFGSAPTPAQAATALGGAALFASVFLWLMWTHQPLQLVPAGPSEVLKVRVAIAFLVILAGFLTFALGAEWRMLFFYHVNVAAGIMLPRRDAYATTAGIATLTFVLGLSSGLAWLAVPATALGLWATSFVGQVAAVAELRDAREELARLAVAEERLRFARDLHDLLGHSLSSIALKSELARRLMPTAPERAVAEVSDIEDLARRSLHEVREAVAGYRRPKLERELEGAREMLEAAGIACRIENGAGKLPKPMEALLAWTVREGTTNVIRHSRAKRCEIRLTREHGEVHAEVVDDGRGPSRIRNGNEDSAARSSAGGNGLSGLAERVAEFAGAAFEANLLAEGGFRLHVSIPLGEGAPREANGQMTPSTTGARPTDEDGRT